MAYKYAWYQEETVLELIFEGDLNIEQLQELNSELFQYYEAAPYPLVLIVDATGAGTLPTNLYQVNSITKDVMKHENSGPIIMIGFATNPILSFLITTIAQILRKTYVNIGSRDQLDVTIRKLTGVA